MKVIPNQSGLHPLGHNILVYPIPTRRKTAGGIELPESAAERRDNAQSEGVVVGIGPLAWQDLHDGTKWAKVSDLVVFSKYAGHPYRGKDGEMYRILADQELVARLEDHTVSEQVEY